MHASFPHMGLRGRHPGIAAFTVVRVAGLVAWLTLWEGAVSVDVAVAGVGVLCFEHNLALAFTCRPTEESEDAPDAAVAQ